MYPCHSFEFHVVLMAIDPVTGKPEIKRYVIGHDCGVVINPHIVKGMTLGGIAHGLGAALLEEFVYDERGPDDDPDASWTTCCRRPTRCRRSRSCITARRRRFTVFGQKGSGESGYLGSPAAISGAINDAVAPSAFRFDKLPIRISAIGDAIAATRNKANGKRTNDHRLPRPSRSAERSSMRFARKAGAVSLAEARDRGRRSLGFSFAGGKADAPGREAAERSCRPPEVDGRAEDRRVRWSAAGSTCSATNFRRRRARAWSRMINDASGAAAKARAALRAARHRAAAGRRARRRSAARGACRGLQGRDDRHPAQGRGRRARRSLARAVLGGGRRTRLGVFIHPVFESGDDRVHDYGMANAVGRITDTLIAVSRHDLCRPRPQLSPTRRSSPASAARRCRYVVGRLRRNYSLDKKLGDPDAAWRRCTTTPSCRTRSALRYPRRHGRRGAHHDGLGHAVPDRRSRADEDRRRDRGFSDAEAASINGGLARKLFGL